MKTINTKSGRRVGGLLVCGFLFFLAGCATNAQTGSLIGAGIGAAAGQWIGGDTGGTLIGAGAGAAAGYMIGNEQDKKEVRDADLDRHNYEDDSGSYEDDGGSYDDDGGGFE